jgi:hypothetical protein
MTFHNYQVVYGQNLWQKQQAEIHYRFFVKFHKFCEVNTSLFFHTCQPFFLLHINVGEAHLLLHFDREKNLGFVLHLHL